jgi:hypothetical protein
MTTHDKLDANDPSGIYEALREENQRLRKAASVAADMRRLCLALGIELREETK